MKTEQYLCKSYIDENCMIQDCTCGKCGGTKNKLSPEYQEYIDTEKSVLRDILRKSRALPGIPLEDIGEIFGEAFSVEELDALIDELVHHHIRKKYRDSATKGGEK